MDLIYDFSNVIDKDIAVSLLPNKTKILPKVPSLQIVIRVLRGHVQNMSSSLIIKKQKIGFFSMQKLPTI